MPNLISPIKNIRIWLGGSFDPGHLGHLAIVQHIATVLESYVTSQTIKDLTITISLLPTAHNPLKPNPTANNHRLAMLKLSLEDLKKGRMQYAPTYPNTIYFQIDTTEIYQTDKVFTFNTFRHFREIYPDDSLIFVLGMDSILDFEKWYRGFELHELCHLWVMPRVQNSDAPPTPSLPSQCVPFLTNNLADLITTPKGRIYLDTHQVMRVSSSQIRLELAKGDTMDKILLKQWLTPSVLDYILGNELYRFPKY